LMLTPEQLARRSNQPDWSFVFSEEALKGGVGLVANVRRITRSQNTATMRFGKIIDINLDIQHFELTEFHSACGLTRAIVFATVLAYLAARPPELRAMLIATCDIAMNSLAWMVFHEVKAEYYIKCVGYNQKGTEKDDCIICLSRDGVWTEEICGVEFRITTGPGVLSGGRVGHFEREDGLAMHKIIWSQNHANSFTYDEQLALRRKYGNDVYWHGLNQYGHAHVHILKDYCYGDHQDGKDIFSIRAREMLLMIQKAVNKSRIFAETDLYHPLPRFIDACPWEGKQYMITLMCISVTLLELPEDPDFLVNFYAIAYAPMVKFIAKAFNCQCIL